MKIDLEKLKAIAVPESEEDIALREDRCRNRLLYKASVKVAAKIRRELRIKNISQEEFAEMFELTEDECKDWLSGKYDFKLSQLAKIEEVMSIDILNKNIVPEKKKLIFDICYNEEDKTAVAAAIKFSKYSSLPTDSDVQIFTKKCENVADYESGNFYKRELPCILSLIEDIDMSDVDVIFTDSYVEFSDEHPGLGRHLYNALDNQYQIIGIAKTKFLSENISAECFRGESKNPLYVTAIGMSNQSAADIVRLFMAGEYRLPEMVKAVDHLCRYGKIN